MTKAYKGTLILTPEERSIIINSIDCYKYFYSTCEDTEDTEGQIILIKGVKELINNNIKLHKL